MTDEDVPDIPILPSQEDVTPPTLVTNETAAQTFIRILGYVDISEEFIDTILAPLRIRTFRMAMILDESQLALRRRPSSLLRIVNSLLSL